VPLVTTHCPCSNTWVVLDRELGVLILVTWVLALVLADVVWSGTTVHSDYVMTTMMKDDLCQKWRV